MNNKLLLILGITILIGCVKDKYTLDENFQVEGLDPSFALSLADVRLNLGNLEQELDADNFIFNENDQTFALVYSAELFSISAQELQSFGPQDYLFDFTLGAGEAAAISALPAGSSTSFSETTPITFDAVNGEELDSIRFAGGSFTLDLNSTISHDLDVVISIPSLTLNGIPLLENVTLNYPGSTPFSSNLSVDLTNYVLDLTNGGTDNNVFDVDLTATITSTGTPTNAGDAIDFEMSIDLSQFQAVHGYFGQIDVAASVDTQFVDLFRDLNGGVLHFADPRIDLRIANSSGVSASIGFAGVFAPENSVDQQMGGPDLTNFPTIEAAAFPGDEAITLHSFTNAGTTPSLTEILDEGPFELIYTSNLTTNPDGPQQNFLIETSSISCSVDMILPFFGFADNFSLADTLELDLAEELNVGEENDFDWDDVKKLTIRLIADNGLPIQLEGQLYFTDSLNNVVDSLFNNQFEAIFQQGFVDFSLPTTDPNYGRVISPTRKITDVVISREKLQFLIDNDVKKAILTSRANTNQAANGEVVRFYPEYNVRLKVSAKLDLDININE
jgi:hypothetical protein